MHENLKLLSSHPMHTLFEIYFECFKKKWFPMSAITLNVEKYENASNQHSFVLYNTKNESIKNVEFSSKSL